MVPSPSRPPTSPDPPQPAAPAVPPSPAADRSSGDAVVRSLALVTERRAVRPAGEMGTSAASDDGAVGPVGAIVWVRRRNGSWWPGRILGVEELQTSQLMPPKTGTPVKLLGREDASVEWYNLEKSIRVKPFRCGEFDACIRRAEASQGIMIKRREKYARREDAILHALELEKQQKSGTILDDTSNKMPGSMNREKSSYHLENNMSNHGTAGCSNFSDYKSHGPSRRVLSSIKEDNVGNPLHMHTERYGKSFSREEDIPENIPRTRGLQDFGLRIAPAKKKHNQFVAWDSLQKSVENHVDDLPSRGQGIGSQRYGSGKNHMPVKRRNLHAGMLEESPAKRRDRRRPLVQVLESSAKLPSLSSFHSDHDTGRIPTEGEKDHMGAICRAKRSRCVYLPAGSSDSLDHAGFSLKNMTTVTQNRTSSCQRQRNPLADDNMSSGLEVMESDSSQRGGSETDMDEEEHVPRASDSQAFYVGQEQVVSWYANLSNPILAGIGTEKDTRSLESKISGRDSIYNPMVSQMHPHERAADSAAVAGVSKWHMKGKRNIRNLSKSPIGLNESAYRSNASMDTSYESKEAGFNMRRTGSLRAVDKGSYVKTEFNDSSILDLDASHTKLTGYSNQRYSSGPKVSKGPVSSFIDSDDEAHVISQSGWEVDGPCHGARRTYWKQLVCSEQTYADHLNDEMETVLVDIDVKARSSYQGEHVPLVSLMSKLNAKAIIGHPVQVGILEDGSSASLFSRYEPNLDEGLAPSPVWKTARRTAIQRVPRSTPARSALESEDSDLQSDPDIKPYKKSYSAQFRHQARLAKKSISQARRSASGKFQRKPLRSVSLSGKKTRKLSSLSTEQKRSADNGDAKFARDSILGRLFRPEGAVPLVPLKVVFSRILESIGRRTSSVAHRVIENGSTAGDPS